MNLKKPKFWDYKEPSIISNLLFPISKLVEIRSSWQKTKKTTSENASVEEEKYKQMLINFIRSPFFIIPMMLILFYILFIICKKIASKIGGEDSSSSSSSSSSSKSSSSKSSSK